MATTRNLDDAARNYERMVKNYLTQMMGGGRAWGPASGLPPGESPPGGMTFRFGQSPNDSQVKEWIGRNGGNPYRSARAKIRGMPGGKQNSTAFRKRNEEAMAAAQAAEGNILQNFLADAQAKMDEANDANKERYADILGRLEGLYGRTMERVQNWGRTATLDALERTERMVGDISGQMAGRGLSNSTVGSAFRMEAEDNLNRNLIDISEKRDERINQADMAQTQNIAGFMERRTDKAPDFNSMMQIAQQYGLGNSGQGFNDGSGGGGMSYQPNQRAPQIQMGGGGGVSAAGAAQMAQNMQAGFFGGMNMPIQYNSPPMMGGGGRRQYGNDRFDPRRRQMAEQRELEEIAARQGRVNERQMDEFFRGWDGPSGPPQIPAYPMPGAGDFFGSYDPNQSYA